jgi:hypothetical protein
VPGVKHGFSFRHTCGAHWAACPNLPGTADPRPWLLSPTLLMSFIGKPE